METTEYGNTDINRLMIGDKNFAFEDKEDFAKHGFSRQAFNEDTEELEDIDEEEEEDAEEFPGDLYEEDSYDDED